MSTSPKSKAQDDEQMERRRSRSTEDELNDQASLSSASQSFRRGFEELDEVARRHRSSFVASDLDNVPDHEIPDRKAMACFVHYLLDLPNLPPDRLQNLWQGLKNPDVSDQLVQSSQLLKKDIEDASQSSRLMDRRQLTELVWNIRSLSKKLGTIHLKLAVQRVLVVTKPGDNSLVRLTWKVVRWMLSRHRDPKFKVFVEARLEDHPLFDLKALYEQEPTAKNRLHFWHPEFVYASPHQIDFVVTLGGDGTVLHTSWLFQGIVPPVLSFSLGSLGFLTKFNFEQYKNTLEHALDKGVIVSLRLRFECTVMRHKPLPKDENEAEDQKQRDEREGRSLVDELIGNKGGCPTHEASEMHHILNDVVVDRGPNPTMSTLEVFGDGEYFTSVQADGICIATPTGSTAYSLAAGGSLCHPENPVILLTAICAHTLNFRPLILPDTIALQIGVPYDARTSSWASFDGRHRTELKPGDYVAISASRYPFASVLPSVKRSREWIRSISSTLNWNARQAQKPYDAERRLDEEYEQQRRSSESS